MEAQRKINMICGILSDAQEQLTFEPSKVEGTLNLVKSILWGKVTIKETEGFAYQFENVNPESRFCLKCLYVHDKEKNCIKKEVQ